MDNTHVLRRRPALLLTMLVAAAVAVFGAAVITPAPAHAAPNPPPMNNGEWDGGPYGSSGSANAVLEMPNAHLLSAGFDYVTIVNPGNNNAVQWPDATNHWTYDAALQSDGSVIVVGQVNFSTAFVKRLIYDNTSLVTDPTFSTLLVFNHINGSSLATVRVLADDSILVGGAFESVTVTGDTTYNINGMAKLTADGDLQTNWTAGAAPGELANVLSFDVDATSGDIYASGWQSVGTSTLRKFSAAGTSAATFATNVEAVWSGFSAYASNAVRVLSDGKVLVGMDGGAGPPVSSWRLNPDGTNDASYTGASLGFAPVYDLWEMSSGRYLISGPTSVQRVNSNGSIDTTWTCGGGTPDPDTGCGSNNNYPFGATEGPSLTAMELKNGKVLVGHQYGYFRLIAVGKPKVTDVSSGGNRQIRIDAYADVDGTTVAGGGGTKLLGFVIQYNNAARIAQGKPNVIWARFIKPPEDGTSSRIVDLSDNQNVATCQSNLIVAGKPSPSCFRNAEIDNDLVSPRTYTAFTMFQDNGTYPLSNFSIYSPGIKGNSLVIVP